MGLATPRYRLVEVYLNDDASPVAANDYRGVYMLEETIKNQKNRLDLKGLDPDDVTPAEGRGRLHPGVRVAGRGGAAGSPAPGSAAAGPTWR